jgi:hypothetical protein
VTPQSAHGWTISEACAEFERAGLPVDPARFRMIIRALPGFKPVGETRSGQLGGRGQALYEIGALQRLHAALAPWLTDTRPASMLRPAEFATDDDEAGLRRVPMRPVTEEEEEADTW